MIIADYEIYPLKIQLINLKKQLVTLLIDSLKPIETIMTLVGYE